MNFAPDFFALLVKIMQMSFKRKFVSNSSIKVIYATTTSETIAAKKLAGGRHSCEGEICHAI